MSVCMCHTKLLEALNLQLFSSVQLCLVHIEYWYQSYLTMSVACQVCGWWIWGEKFVTTTENVCGNQRVLLFCPMFWVAGYCGSGCFWLFITRLYSSDLRLGWQNRILMTARAQCHQTDNTHYNQAIPGHQHQLSCIMLSSRQFYKTHWFLPQHGSSHSHSVPPLDNFIRDMIQEIWMSSYGIRDHQTGISIVSANIGPLAELQIIKSTIEWNLWGHFRDTKQTRAHGVFPMAWLIPPTLSILRPHPDPESSPFSLAFNFLWPRQKWWV